MCLGGGGAPKTPVVPESVKRVSADQRRTVSQNNEQAALAASATNPQARGAGGLQTEASTQKKSLLGS